MTSWIMSLQTAIFLQSVFYKQLQDTSKRSPYGMTVQKKTGSLKVS